MPRITVKTNVFLNREKKYRMTLEFKEAIELIPCEKASFVRLILKMRLLCCLEMKQHQIPVQQ